MISRKKLLLVVPVILIFSLTIGSFVLASDVDEEVEEEQEVVETKEAKLYFSDMHLKSLVTETREIETDDFLKNLINELIVGPKNEELLITMPENTKVLNIKEKDNQVIVDFSQELIKEHWRGSSAEIITVNSIINTITQFETIEKVKILIAGEKIENFGQLEVDNPATYNSEIIK